MEHIITSIFINTEDKDKKPYKTKEGKPFKIVKIKVAEDSKNPQEWDDKYLSCLVFKESACLGWQSGDTVNIKVEKKDDFFNFRTPDRIDLLEGRVKILEDFMGNGGKEVEELPDKEELPTVEHDEDIPF